MLLLISSLILYLLSSWSVTSSKAALASPAFPTTHQHHPPLSRFSM